MTDAKVTDRCGRSRCERPSVVLLTIGELVTCGACDEHVDLIRHHFIGAGFTVTTAPLGPEGEP